MPRPRKPVQMQSKNLTKEEKENKIIEEKMIVQGKEMLEKPPTWLNDPLAKKEFKRIVSEFEKMEIDVIGNLDINNLGGYCNSFASYVKVTKTLKKEEILIEKETRYGTTIVRNPLIDVQKMYSEEMRKFAAMCGLTIDSRLKAATVTREKTDADIEDEFGDF